METMPFVLLSSEPVTFTFTFDEAAIQQYLATESGKYQEISSTYGSIMEDYMSDTAPILEEI